MTSSLRAVWESLPTELDPERHLGYGAEPLTAIDTLEEDGQVILLPSEESQLEADEYMVADEGAIEPLRDWV